MGVLKIHKNVEIVQQSRQIVEVGVGVGRFFVDFQHTHIFEVGLDRGYTPGPNPTLTLGFYHFNEFSSCK